MMFIDPDLVFGPEFLAQWHLCSLAMPPLMQIGRIVLVDEFVEAIDWAEVAVAMAYGVPL